MSSYGSRFGSEVSKTSSKLAEAKTKCAMAKLRLQQVEQKQMLERKQQELKLISIRTFRCQEFCRHGAVGS